MPADKTLKTIVAELAEYCIRSTGCSDLRLLPSLGIGSLSAREAEGRTDISSADKSHELFEPDELPEDTLTFLNVFDRFMLSARKDGVFMVQAASNKGSSPYMIVSYSPWAMGVAT
ncbi:unnamed protein product [Camellia sinensis]